MSIALASAAADDTLAIGRALAPVFSDGDTVILTGDLGAGKTTLVRGICDGLEVAEHVASPTFTLVREYHGRLQVAHVDVYRLARLQDVVDLALDELGGGHDLLLVEWGDVVQELLPADRLRIELRVPDLVGTDETRRIELTGEGPTWVERWERVGELLAGWRAPVVEGSAPGGRSPCS